MFVSVGSATNDAESMNRLDAAGVQRWEQEKPAGAAWGSDTERADVLVFDAQGRNGRIFATGIRNCVTVAINPATGDPWCATNERDGMGDNLPPDYVTRGTRSGSFLRLATLVPSTWEPTEDPRHVEQERLRPQESKITVPDVLIQPHSGATADDVLVLGTSSRPISKATHPWRCMVLEPGDPHRL